MVKKLTIKERILSFLDEVGVKKSDFFQATGIQSSNFKGKNLQSQIGGDMLIKILSIYKELSPSWLMLGEGNMLLATTGNQVSEERVGNTSPFFDVDFSGGFDDILNDQTITPDCYISVPGFEKADFWCNVRGNSMSPQICNGDIIALKECPPDSIIYGEIYAVVLDNVRTVKKIRRSYSDDYLRFIPINPEFDEQEYHKKRIIRVYEVLGSISKFF